MELADPSLTDLQAVGSGGFATVYSAIDVGFGRKVAVKVLHGLDDAARRRFDRERLLMGQLSAHPNVITPFRFGTTPKGDPYLVMEFAEGGSLAEITERRGSIPWDEAVRYIRPIAEALAHSHRHGVLHKDVKPDNILLTGAGVPKLTDFGIASTQGSQLTSKGYTLDHSPPETFVTGIDDARDPRSDLYSLASSLFTLVAGHAPFSIGGADSVPALMRRIDSQPVPSLGHPGIDGFFTQAMAKSPDHRPNNGEEFLALLDNATRAVHSAAQVDHSGATRMDNTAGTRIEAPHTAGTPAGLAHSGLEPGQAQSSSSSKGQRITLGVVLVALIVAAAVGASQLLSDKSGGAPVAGDPAEQVAGPDSDSALSSTTPSSPPEGQADEELTPAQQTRNLLSDERSLLRQLLDDSVLPRNADGVATSFTADNCEIRLETFQALHGPTYLTDLNQELDQYPESFRIRFQAYVDHLVQGYERCRDEGSTRPIGTHVLTSWVSINAYLCATGVTNSLAGPENNAECAENRPLEVTNAAELAACEKLLRDLVEDFFAALTDQKPPVAQACAAAQSNDPNWFAPN